jgi:Family of unknown function (DUF6529)
MPRAANQVSAAQATHSAPWLALPLVLGALVSLSVGLIAREEAIAPGTYPGGYFRLFFSDSLYLKVWFATAALALGVTQLVSAAWIFGKLPWRRPAFLPAAHRWIGRLAFACTLPVAYHCIFKLGFQTTSGRVLAHSLLGCAFYGAFAAKVTIVRVHRYPRWVLPFAGGLLFATLLAVWYTSALWLFRRAGVGL